MLVYQKVRAYLDDQGIKLTVVARKAGIPYATFSAMMNGHRTMFAEDLRTICYVLNVSPEKFIELDQTDDST